MVVVVAELAAWFDSHCKELAGLALEKPVDPRKNCKQLDKVQALTALGACIGNQSSIDCISWDREAGLDIPSLGRTPSEGPRVADGMVAIAAVAPSFDSGRHSDSNCGQYVPNRPEVTMCALQLTFDLLARLFMKYWSLSRLLPHGFSPSLADESILWHPANTVSSRTRIIVIDPLLE